MRTTLDLPDNLLRTLKIRAAQSDVSLKALLNDLIVRALALPNADAAAPPATAVLPTLARLHAHTPIRTPPILSNAQIADLELEGDLDNMRRSGFIV